MIDINTLLKNRPLKGNYFAPDAYLQGDNEFGLLENRSGARLLAIPDTLLKGLFTALEEELGSGSGIALFSCGRSWGKSCVSEQNLHVAEAFTRISVHIGNSKLSRGSQLHTSFKPLTRLRNMSFRDRSITLTPFDNLDMAGADALCYHLPSTFR
jgi:hypothetical protein